MREADSDRSRAADSRRSGAADPPTPRAADDSDPATPRRGGRARKPAGRESQLERALEGKTARKIQARAEGDRGMWFGLGMMGLVGWSVAVPTVAGIALGVWVDSRFEAPGSVSWTLTGLVLGVALGCANAWFWVQKELDDR